jgi:hypothetical protein
MSTQLIRQITDPPLGPDLPLPGSERAAVPETESAGAVQIDEIVERLSLRFSPEQISEADLRGRVRGFYDQFARARVRTFIAIFVERYVRRSIEAPSLSSQAL